MPDGTTKSTSILIVGAGPVGLSAAVELTRRGYSPRIIEKDPGPHEESRALAINPRTLDILEPSGVTDDLLNAGRKARALNIHGPHGRLFRLETRNIPHATRNYMLVLAQAETERLLIEALGGMASIGWKTELTDVALQGDAIQVSLNRDGRREKATPDILIGADGAHSAVRHALGIGFAGSAYEHDWGLVDAYLDGLPPEELHVFDLSPLLIGFIPIRDNLFRIVTDRADALANVPKHIRVEKVVWESRFRISHRQVETYQKGPVFLAGDAAHIHSPLGGRGMNLGIEDSAWLAWLIERGETDRFTDIRHPVAKSVLSRVDAATRFMSADGAVTTFLRRRVMPLIARLQPVQRYALRTVSGLDVDAPPWL